MSAAESRVSIREFLAMPEEDAWRVELMHGQVVREPRPATLHGAVQVQIAWLLQSHVRAHALGGLVLTDTGFIVARDPDTVLGPDVAFVSAERLPADPWATTFLTDAPDLAIEILSPANSSRLMTGKVRLYLAAGAARVWIVDPARRTVTEHRPESQPARVAAGDDGVLDLDPVLAGLRIPVSAIFP